MRACKKVDFRINAKNVENSAKDSRGGDLSLRDFALAKSWQSNSAPAESNQINGARKACNLESVVGGLGAKGVKKEGGIRESSLPIQAPPSPLERTLSQAKLESSNNAQRVDSRIFDTNAASKNEGSSYQRCVGKDSSVGFVWSCMDSRVWDKMCRVCCWDSRSFFKDSKDSKISLLDCSNSGLLNFNAKGFLPAVINIALTNPKAPDPAKNPIKNSKPYIMTPLQKIGDYIKKGDSYGVG